MNCCVLRVINLQMKVPLNTKPFPLIKLKTLVYIVNSKLKKLNFYIYIEHKCQQHTLDLVSLNHGAHLWQKNCLEDKLWTVLHLNKYFESLSDFLICANFVSS